MFAGLLVAGCSTTLVRDTPLTVELGEGGVTAASCATAPIAEALLEKQGVSVQALSGHWKSQTFAAECVLKGEAGRFTAVFLAPHRRLATLVITPPHTLTFDRAREIPAAFEPEYLLFDLAVVNLDTERLRRALGDTFSVQESGKVRKVSAAGRELATLVRENDGRNTYENRVFGYGYVIKEVR